ncbi:MAG: DUF4160 domain-containing protein [Candidatus Omnitrophota bacterium]|jgi:hypothetical protein|nr:MAG: DUF4160 domain-containing protein [Candidatus Omnitrophota bacterium]
MPEISRFFGIVISMYHNEHPPPHFHVRYAEQKAIIDIYNLRLIEGYLSPRVYGLVMEWAFLYQKDLVDNWERGRENSLMQKIPPLE